MQEGPEKVFEPDPNPKNSPEEPKCAKRPKIWPNKKQKDWTILPIQKLIVYISRS